MSSSSYLAEENSKKRDSESPDADCPSPVPLTTVRMKKNRSSLPRAADHPGGESATSPVHRTWARMKKRKGNPAPPADAPEEITESDTHVHRTWAAMKKRPRVLDAPEEPAASAKRKKGTHRARRNSKGSGVKNPRQALEERQFVSSLAEPELDLLISLKQLAERRAETIKQRTLANKFDLRVLRALGFVLLEHFKEECKKASVFPNKAETSSGYNHFNLSLVPYNSETSSGFNQFNLTSQSTGSNTER